MLRVSTPTAHQDVASMGANSFFNLDKRKKQVTLIDPTTCSGTSAPEDRRVGVAAPKMFAFDAMFSQDDSQVIIAYYTVSHTFSTYFHIYLVYIDLE